MLRVAHRSQRVSASGFKCHYWPTQRCRSERPSTKTDPLIYYPLPTPYLSICNIPTYIHHLGCAHGIHSHNLRHRNLRKLAAELALKSEMLQKVLQLAVVFPLRDQ